MARPHDKGLQSEHAIEELLLGVSRVQALYVAVQLNIPDLLAAGPASSTLMASSSGVHPGALHRLLRFLAADGWVELREDGRFAKTPLLEPLETASASGIRAHVIGTATRGWEVWSHLLYSVETGQPAFERVFGKRYFEEQQGSEAALRLFDAGLAPGARETGAALAAALPPAARVADLGAGSGALLAGILGAWPNAHGVAFDSAQALELARQRLGDAGLAGRVAFEEGDFFERVPAGADLYVLSIILHDWDDEQCLRILRNCQTAMAPGSRLVICERIVPDDPRSERGAAYADIGMLVMTGGRERTLAEFEALIARAGLRLDRVTPLATSRKVVAIEASRGLL